jgi:hypothetical protein
MLWRGGVVGGGLTRWRRLWRIIIVVVTAGCSVGGRGQRHGMMPRAALGEWSPLSRLFRKGRIQMEQAFNEQIPKDFI